MKSRQQIKKLVDKVCYFCGEDRYEILDCHRIIEGKDGGTYHPLNTLTICCNCHRKTHTGIIKILGKHLCSNGKYVVIYIEDGVEKIR